MKFYALASGSKGNCFIVETNASRLMIDCGTSKRYLMDNMNALGITLEDIDGLLVTHDHTDHTRLIQTFKNHTVFAPSDLQIESHKVIPYESFQFKDFTIIPIPTSHDVEHSVGYIIETTHHKLVYITDTGYIKDFDLQFMTNADYIILESNHDPELLMKTRRPYSIKQRILSETGHLSNEEAGLILSRIVTHNTKEIVLAHLSEDANTTELAIKTTKKHLNGYGGLLKAALQHEVVTSG